MNLKTVIIPKKTSEYDGLHVEAPGCIVEIKKNVFDASEDRRVTTVTIVADQDSGEECWLPDLGGQRFHVRVAEGKPEEFPFAIEQEKHIAEGMRKVIYVGYRGRFWRLEFAQSGGSYYFATLKSREPEIELFLGEFRREDHKDFWPIKYEENIERAKESLKRMYAIAQGG